MFVHNGGTIDGEEVGVEENYLAKNVEEEKVSMKNGKRWMLLYCLCTYIIRYIFWLHRRSTQWWDNRWRRRWC